MTARPQFGQEWDRDPRCWVCPCWCNPRNNKKTNAVRKVCTSSEGKQTRYYMHMPFLKQAKHANVITTASASEEDSFTSEDQWWQKRRLLIINPACAFVRWFTLYNQDQISLNIKFQDLFFCLQDYVKNVKRWDERQQSRCCRLI